MFLDSSVEASEGRDDADRHTFDQQVLEIANSYLRWFTDGIVREEMSKLKPEIRAAVLAILNPILSKCDGKIDTELVKKSLADVAEYAYCPHCYSRVFNSSITLIARPCSASAMRGG